MGICIIADWSLEICKPVFKTGFYARYDGVPLWIWTLSYTPWLINIPFVCRNFHQGINSVLHRKELRQTCLVRFYPWSGTSDPTVSEALWRDVTGLNQFVRIPRRSIIGCFLSLLPKPVYCKPYTVWDRLFMTTHAAVDIEFDCGEFFRRKQYSLPARPRSHQFTKKSQQKLWFTLINKTYPKTGCHQWKSTQCPLKSV